jgi:hypothetical protein
MITMKEKNAFQACVPFVLWNYINTQTQAPLHLVSTHGHTLVALFLDQRWAAPSVPSTNLVIDSQAFFSFHHLRQTGIMRYV